MDAILENVYRTLAAEKYRFTESEFSEQYLGKSGTYFAYLKCTGKQVSVDALLKLWGKLNAEHKVCSSDINRPEHAFRRQMLMDSNNMYQKLIEDVYSELCDRACTVKTEPVHS
jgi:hypothetical protein